MRPATEHCALVQFLPHHRGTRLRNILARVAFASILLLPRTASVALNHPATSSSRPGSPLTGIWHARWSASGGVPVGIYLQLQQQGSVLTGNVEMTWGTEAIHQGARDGDRFKLLLGSETVPIRIEGTVRGRELAFTLTEPRQPVKQLIALPATSGPSWPPKQALPPLHNSSPLAQLAAPIMGWSSWNTFNENVSEADIRATAAMLQRSGLHKAGYRYLNIDEGWNGQRNSSGSLQANRKFANLRTLADWLHERGFLLGLYSSPGPTTCGGYPGSFGHEATDALQFAAWRIDYLKYDWCSAGKTYGAGDMPLVYQQMGDALARTGWPIVYETCQYGLASVEGWGPKTGATIWRTTGDIAASWASVHDNAVRNETRRLAAGVNRFNDPDALEVGNPGLSLEESRSQLSLWSISAAPLIIATDLRRLDPAVIALLKNPEMIALDQDRLAIPGRRVVRGNGEIWLRPLASGELGVAFVNSSSSPITMTVRFDELGLSQTPMRVRDLWRHTDEAAGSAELRIELASHGSALYRLTP